MVSERSTSPARRWGMSCAALVCIGIQLSGSLCCAVLALGLWLGVLCCCDRPVLRRLWLPRFWLMTLVFALASGLLLGPRGGHGIWRAVSQQGLAAGGMMLVRGAFIFALASWASRALGSRDLQRVTRGMGIAPLGTALAAAFQLLPELEARLRAARERRGSTLRGLRQLAVQLVAEAARLADEVAGQRSRPLLAAVVGAPHSGKTTLLAKLVARMQREGIHIGGVTQPTIREGDLILGYRLRCAATGEEHPLAERGAEGFSFLEESWRWAHERIRAARQKLEVLVVDELGRLEAKGAGHLPALLEQLGHERARVHLLGVRADCAAALQEQLAPFDLVLQTGADEVTVDVFTNHVLQRLAQGERDDSPQALPHAVPPPDSCC